MTSMRAGRFKQTIYDRHYKVLIQHPLIWRLLFLFAEAAERARLPVLAGSALRALSTQRQNGTWHFKHSICIYLYNGRFRIYKKKLWKNTGAIIKDEWRGRRVRKLSFWWYKFEVKALLLNIECWVRGFQYLLLAERYLFVGKYVFRVGVCTECNGLYKKFRWFIFVSVYFRFEWMRWVFSVDNCVLCIFVSIRKVFLYNIFRKSLFSCIYI